MFDDLGFDGVDVVIFDEVYECVFEMDFLIGLFFEVCELWDDLVLVIMLVMVDVVCFVVVIGIDDCFVLIVDYVVFVFLFIECWVLSFVLCLDECGVIWGFFDYVVGVVIVVVVELVCDDMVVDVLVFVLGVCEVLEIVGCICVVSSVFDVWELYGWIFLFEQDVVIWGCMVGDLFCIIVMIFFVEFLFIVFGVCFVVDSCLL